MAGAERAQLRLLGDFQLTVDGIPVRLAPSAMRLFAFLGVQGGGASRDKALAMLWPESDAARGAGNLRTTVWRLPASARPLILNTAERISLCEVAVDVDALVAR